MCYKSTLKRSIFRTVKSKNLLFYIWSNVHPTLKAHLRKATIVTPNILFPFLFKIMLIL